MSTADKDGMSVFFTRTGPVFGGHMDAETVKRNPNDGGDDEYEYEDEDQNEDGDGDEDEDEPDK